MLLSALALEHIHKQLARCFEFACGNRVGTTTKPLQLDLRSHRGELLCGCGDAGPGYMRVWIPGTKERGCSGKAAGMMQVKIGRPDQSTGKGNRGPVTSWVSRHELRRETGSLREATDNNAVMGQASVQGELNRLSYLRKRR